VERRKERDKDSIQLLLNLFYNFYHEWREGRKEIRRRRGRVGSFF
jgi:hypothetical protein